MEGDTRVAEVTLPDCTAVGRFDTGETAGRPRCCGWGESDVMRKWNLVIDVGKWENCHKCSLEWASDHIGNSFAGYAARQLGHGHEWGRIARDVRGDGSMLDAAFSLTACSNCDNPPYGTTVSEAVYKCGDGKVLINRKKAHGRRNIVEVCHMGRSGGTKSGNCRKTGTATYSGRSGGGVSAGVPGRARREQYGA